MTPPYDITPKILQFISSISHKIGEVKSAHLTKPETHLRKKNRIKTIQSSLEIEGNTLTEKQITALLNNERVIAPEKDLIEVSNAIDVYDQLRTFDFKNITHFKKAHKTLMSDLIDSNGKFRTSNVGIVKGSKVAHLAPPGDLINGLMKDLFSYLKNPEEITLIKSCVFHYELEFIHPFVDGNGRMGRLWQTIILLQEHDVFEYLPIEQLIKENQNEYYNALNQSDKSGKATIFIEFMLSIIERALIKRLETTSIKLTAESRIRMFIESFNLDNFTRKDYMSFFKKTSTATASRDLKLAVEKGLIMKLGEKRNTTYTIRERQP